MGALNRELRGLDVFNFRNHLARTKPESEWLSTLDSIDPGLYYTQAMMMTYHTPITLAHSWPTSWDHSKNGHFGRFLTATYKRWVHDWRLSNSDTDEECTDEQELDKGPDTGHEVNDEHDETDNVQEKLLGDDRDRDEGDKDDTILDDMAVDGYSKLVSLNLVLYLLRLLVVSVHMVAAFVADGISVKPTASSG